MKKMEKIKIKLSTFQAAAVACLVLEAQERIKVSDLSQNAIVAAICTETLATIIKQHSHNGFSLSLRVSEALALAMMIGTIEVHDQAVIWLLDIQNTLNQELLKPQTMLI